MSTPTDTSSTEPAEPLFEGKAIKAGWWVILFNGWDPRPSILDRIGVET
jgi:hypothetical protein